MSNMLMRGFSLVELMVVVAIIGIIAAVAYPSYQGYVCDTYNGQAIADLRACAMGMDRYHSNGFTYLGATIDGTNNSVCVNQSPSQGPAQFTIGFDGTLTVNNYTLKATPTAGNSCGGAGFTLDASNNLTEL